jgi:two-component system NtrC family sensor kinase
MRCKQEKKFVKILSLFLLLAFNTGAQNKFVDSLKRQLPNLKEDTTGALLLSDLCYYFRYTNVDSSLYYGNAAISLCKKLRFLRGEADALNKMGLAYREKGDLPKSLELQFKALQISTDNNYIIVKANCLRRIAHVYRDLKDFPAALKFSYSALANSLSIDDTRGVAIEYMNLAITHYDARQIDSASYYGFKALKEINYLEDVAAEVYRILGDISVADGKRNDGLFYYDKGIETGLANNDYRTLSYLYSDMAAMYKNLNNRDSTIYCAEKGIRYGQLSSYKKGIMLSGNILSEIYDASNPSLALKYFRMASAAKDSLYGAGNIQTIQNIVEKEEGRQQELADARNEYEEKVKTYIFITALSILGCITFVFFWTDRRKKKANVTLTKQKNELANALQQLKSTQAQLLHAEKMASLGELTAGIAHEIQNPLNFVNNFSELSTELLTDMQVELENGNMADAKSIASDLQQNLEKINHHGKRADAIVKGMLQHSRSSKGEKALTELNDLIDEYLRMAYHSISTKDSSMKVILKTEFDESIRQVDIVPQDFGRVLLNLFTNAFYAIGEKKKVDPEYVPEVYVATERIDDSITITIRDNGMGIPANIVGKIFQPFFTTKPTGQGTGLGLSLSYDIVKAHGGEIAVKSEAGNGSEFTIRLHNIPG